MTEPIGVIWPRINIIRLSCIMLTWENRIRCEWARSLLAKFYLNKATILIKVYRKCLVHLPLCIMKI